MFKADVGQVRWCEAIVQLLTRVEGGRWSKVQSLLPLLWLRPSSSFKLLLLLLPLPVAGGGGGSVSVGGGSVAKVLRRRA